MDAVISNMKQTLNYNTIYMAMIKKPFLIRALSILVLLLKKKGESVIEMFQLKEGRFINLIDL